MGDPTETKLIDLRMRSLEDEKNRINAKINIQDHRITTMFKANEKGHQAILKGQDKLNDRFDSFLQGQTNQYSKTVTALCDHIDGRLDDTFQKHGTDITKMKDVMFGQDKDGGLVSKAEGLKRSTIALWTVTSFIVLILTTLLGFVIAGG